MISAGRDGPRAAQRAKSSVMLRSPPEPVTAASGTGPRRLTGWGRAGEFWLPLQDPWRPDDRPAAPEESVDGTVGGTIEDRAVAPPRPGAAGGGRRGGALGAARARRRRGDRRHAAGDAGQPVRSVARPARGGGQW